MTSASGVRWTTFPGVTATVLPTSNRSDAIGAWPAAARTTSCAKFAAPRRRLAPPSDHVRVSTAGLVQNEFDGATVSRTCRAAKVTALSCCLLTPRTSLVADSHQRSIDRNEWA